MADETKRIVSDAYDHIATWYLSWTTSTPSPRERYTEKLLSLLPTPSPSILELGCGPGVPILELLLSRGASVTANDISPKQIEMARARYPEARFVEGDMSWLSFAPGSFHGALSFFTLFHLPRKELGAMLSRVHAWLQPGGVFVFNLATVDEEEIHGEMMGHGMFWSSFGTGENREIVEGAGFEVLEVEVVKAGEGTLEEGDADYDTEFMWIVARRKGSLEGAERVVS